MAKTKSVTKNFFSFLSNKVVLFAMLLVVVFGGWQAYQSSVQDIDIFQVGQSGADTFPMYNSWDDSGMPPIYQCNDSLARFMVQNSCGYQMFRSMTYRCRSNSQVITLGYAKNKDKSICKTYASWYKQAESACSVKCGGSVPPAPVPSTTTNCVVAPAECIDSNGTISLCDPQPGVNWCAPGQTPPSPPVGCRYEQVKCFKAPCPMMMICKPK